MTLVKTVLTSFILIVTAGVIYGAAPLTEKPSLNAGVYGSWDAMNLEQAGMTVHAILIIKKNQVTFSNTCSFGEFSVLAEVSSPVVITDDEIQILESKKVMKEHSPGFLQCRASVTAQTMQYQLRNGKLALSVPEENQTIELSRTSR